MEKECELMVTEQNQLLTFIYSSIHIKGSDSWPFTMKVYVCTYMCILQCYFCIKYG
jgi:hypothetical protein